VPSESEQVAMAASAAEIAGRCILKFEPRLVELFGDENAYRMRGRARESFSELPGPKHLSNLAKWCRTP